MDKPTLEEKVRRNFIKAASEFGFTFISPYCLDEEKKLYAFAFIPGYGSEHGAVIELMYPPDHKTNSDIKEICSERGLWCSFINAETYGNTYSYPIFAEMLNDWKI